MFNLKPTVYSYGILSLNKDYNETKQKIVQKTLVQYLPYLMDNVPPTYAPTSPPIVKMDTIMDHKKVSSCSDISDSYRSLHVWLMKFITC